jgi:hypothetical protein
MEKDAVGSLTDTVLNEFYNNGNAGAYRKKKGSKSRYPHVLESLDSQADGKGFSVAQSAKSLRDSSNSQFALQSSLVGTKSLSTLKPLPVNDYHRVTDLMHRIAPVSGSIPDQVVLSPLPAVSSSEIAANMPEYQLKAMKESTSLREIMEKVIQLHEELGEIISSQLIHRKELGKQVGDVNDRYIRLFEHSLSEMLKTQRTKFKVRRNAMIFCKPIITCKPIIDYCILFCDFYGDDCSRRRKT